MNWTVDLYDGLSGRWVSIHFPRPHKRKDGALRAAIRHLETHAPGCSRIRLNLGGQPHSEIERRWVLTREHKAARKMAA